MEQQLAARLAEWQIAKLVDDDEVIAQQLLGKASTSASGLLLFELIDQIDQIEEAPPGPGADDRRGDTDTEMGLAGAGSADEDGVAPVVEESAGCQLTDFALIDRCVGKDKAVEVFQHRELGAADAIADGPGLPVSALRPDQAGEERIELLAAGQALAGDLVEAGAHAVELEFAHGFENLMAFHQATLLMRS